MIDLSSLTHDELLLKRLKELPLSIKGTWLEKCVNKLYVELSRKGIKFRPECYLADEWLTPDKVPVVGIPFYLAHPVLIKLEKKMMFEVEGGTKKSCMELLRHETGHAINYAYKLYKDKKWRKLFGRFSKEYGDFYRFRPYSKSFVRHLDNYYAQCHPDEDFAETFAVWLNPDRNWREEYKGWKAMDKLVFMNETMRQISEKDPVVGGGKKHWHIVALSGTLKNYYKKKKDLWQEEFPDFHDGYLAKIFIKKNGKDPDIIPASQIIKKYKKNMLDSIALCTGERRFMINDILRELIKRCDKLKLCAKEDTGVMVGEVASYVTMLIMNYIYTGRFKG